MSRLSLSRRHDPFWEVDGAAARGARRRQRTVSSLAFAASVVAVAGATLAWAAELGVASAAGIHLLLPVG